MNLSRLIVSEEDKNSLNIASHFYLLDGRRTKDVDWPENGFSASASKMAVDKG